MLDILATNSSYTLPKIERLEILWNGLSSTRALVDNVPFDNIQHLGMSCVQQPPSVSFLYNMCLLAENTGVNLTVVEIILQGPSAAKPLRCGQFLHYIRDLRARRHLRRLAIILTGYSFILSADDVESIAKSWPKLQVLHLSFTLYYHFPASMANFQQTIPLVCARCPNLSFLHLPGLAARPGQSVFFLQDMPDSKLQHLSSDVLIISYNPIDIAFALCAAFPRLAQLGLPGANGQWLALHQLLCAFIHKDHTFILEHTTAFLRSGVYEGLP